MHSVLHSAHAQELQRSAQVEQRPSWSWRCFVISTTTFRLHRLHGLTDPLWPEELAGLVLPMAQVMSMRMPLSVYTYSPLPCHTRRRRCRPHLPADSDTNGFTTTMFATTTDKWRISEGRRVLLGQFQPAFALIPIGCRELQSYSNNQRQHRPSIHSQVSSLTMSVVQPCTASG